MKYAIYWTISNPNNKWGDKDTTNVSSAKERDVVMSQLLRDKRNITEIAYCPIYASGEYGKRRFVRG